MERKYIIVGGIAGGTSAAMRLRRLDERARITIFEKGPAVSFSSCGLPYYVGGVVKSADGLILQTPGDFKKKHNITVKVNTEVISINRREKKVELKNLSTGRRYQQKYDKIVLATGAVPLKPETAIDSDKVFVLRTMADSISITEHIEKNDVRRAIILGGGYIGLEIAENISRRGITTTLVEENSHVLPAFDDDMAVFAEMELRKKGMLIITGAKLVSMNESEHGVGVELSNGGKLSADMVILGGGVAPEVSLARSAGLGIGVTGGILVDERQQTTDKDIYAVGDVVEVECLSGGKAVIPLASPAEKQGRIAADNICGLNSKYRKTLGVTILKLFDSVFASAGLSETTLKEREESYEKIYIRAYSHAPYYPGAGVMTIKLMFEKRMGRILGVQIAGGDGVDKRIDVIATAMRAGLTADRLSELELAYAPPFGAPKDPVNIAGYVASDLMEGLSDIVHWHDIDGAADALLVDLRPKNEYEAGTINGAINIPADELRGRISELPEDKEIILFCGNGQAAYTAERMLKQRGYDVKSLSGGYSLYEILCSNKAAKQQ
jgi:NADPH-dependent 2,4-dienoyl-CoA reductase/sulfur reductase-like enzyme/rhodanese-related sulfurtransferase